MTVGDALERLGGLVAGAHVEDADEALDAIKDALAPPYAIIVRGVLVSPDRDGMDVWPVYATGEAAEEALSRLRRQAREKATIVRLKVVGR